MLATIPAPGGGSGLAWAEGSLWVGQHRNRKIHQVDPETGAVLRTIESNRFVTGVTWVDGELWHATWEGDESDLRRLDPQTGEVLEKLDMPPGVGISGLSPMAATGSSAAVAAAARCGWSGGRGKAPPPAPRASNRSGVTVTVHHIALPPLALGRQSADTIGQFECTVTLIPFDRGQIESRSQSTLPSPIQCRVASRLQEIGARTEVGKFLIEGNHTTAWNKAFPLLFRTRVECAQAAEIAVADGFDQKDVELMIDDAGSGVRLEGAAKSLRGGAAERSKPLLRIDPKRQIEIEAFMPNLDAFTTELRKPRDFLPEWLGHRADHGHRPHFGRRSPCMGNEISRNSELALPRQQVAVLSPILAGLTTLIQKSHEITLAAMPALRSAT